jgi:DNA segregation ATPase FtsK/SpoIIIE, S-DNA-T family
MAKASKSKRKATNPDEFQPEQTESVEVNSLLKDERTMKIIGTFLLLLGTFLFIAFVSYLFTWKEDQDKVLAAGREFLFSDNIAVENLMGRLGAWVAHFFFYRGFGLSSFLICSIFFVAGINLLFGKKLFSLWRNLKYILAGLVYFSMVFAAAKSWLPAFPFGGAVGELIVDWLQKFVGQAGVFISLAVLGFAYLIWRFNPQFSVPDWQRSAATADAELSTVDTTSPSTKVGTEPSHSPATIWMDESFSDQAAQKVPVRSSGGIVVIPPADAQASSIPMEVIEREEEQETDRESTSVLAPVMQEPPLPLAIETPSAAVTEMPAPVKSKGVQPSDLTLEIKTAELPEEEMEVDGPVRTQDMPNYEPTLDLRDYKYPSLDLLETHGSEKIIQDPAELETNKNQIINTLKNYDITIQKISATVGPTVTLYEIVPAAGVRISRIKNLEDDIALSLAALGIRIIAPIPGKGTIGIEVPNVKKTVVSMKTLLASDKFQHSTHALPIAIGKRIDNELFIVDLAAMPHLLMAGATGQGKSVGLNAILVSLLYKKHPSQLKFVLVDPKKVELSIYRSIEKHFLAKLPGEEEAIITDTKKVIHTLNALCIEMDNRYDLLKEAGTRNIKEYNEKFVRRKLNPQKGHQFLPFIVLVVDEFADLIMTAGKEVEMPIARLAQLARAVGIHLIIATQRPSVNIITGTIKANFPARIAFKVSSKIDSRTILDTGGAEQLIGKGDMLISYNGELTRLQCAFVDTPEVENVNEFIGDQRGYPQAFLLPEYVDEKEMEGRDFDLSDRDPLFEDAARLIVANQMGSTSLIQRRMKLGYNRAGRLMDQLETAGVVGPNLGSKAREVLIKTDADLESFLQNMA